MQPWQTVGMADKATKLLSFVFLTYVRFSFLRGGVGGEGGCRSTSFWCSGAELILKVGSSLNIYCLIYAFGLKFQAR